MRASLSFVLVVLLSVSGSGVSWAASPVCQTPFFKNEALLSLVPDGERRLYKFRDPKSGVLRFVTLTGMNLPPRDRRTPIFIPAGERISFQRLDTAETARNRSFATPITLYPHWGRVGHTEDFSQKPFATTQGSSPTLYYYKMNHLAPFLDPMHIRFIEHRTGNLRKDLDRIASWIKEDFTYDLPFADIDRLRPMPLHVVAKFKRGVCRHYAILLKILLEELGFEAHLFNVHWQEKSHLSVLIRADGQEYIVDPLFTWTFRGKNTHVTQRSRVHMTYYDLGPDQKVSKEAIITFATRPLTPARWKDFRTQFRPDVMVAGLGRPVIYPGMLRAILEQEFQSFSPDLNAVSQYVQELIHLMVIEKVPDYVLKNLGTTITQFKNTQHWKLPPKDISKLRLLLDQLELTLLTATISRILSQNPSPHTPSDNSR